VARILSIHRGPVGHFVADDGTAVESAIRKRVCTGPAIVSVRGIEGDTCAETDAHGGPNRALHAFPIEGYRHFEGLAGRAFGLPTFGENLTVEGYDEFEARVGDRLRAGSTLLEVTMPTERCPKPGRSAGEPRLLKWILESFRTGFYLRVLEPGTVVAGDPIELTARGPAEWTVERLTRALYREIEDEALLRRTHAILELAPEWKARLDVHYERRVRSGTGS
jgi:MOSC domain-containing protein YiiM